MSSDRNDITIEELLHAVLDTAEDEAAREPAGRTIECLTFRKLEAHAKKIRFLTGEEMRHVNRCPDYCQPNLDTFRKHFNPHVPAFDTSPVQRLAAHQEEGGHTVYSAVLESERGDVLGPANIVVTDGPFVANGRYLVFRLIVTEPRFQPEMLPLRLSMTDVGRVGDPIFTFDLPTATNEIVKIRIPQDLAKEDRWRNVEETGHMPLVFVVQPVGSYDLKAL